LSITKSGDKYQVRIVRKEAGVDTRRLVATRAEAERLELQILADIATTEPTSEKLGSITLKEAADLAYELNWKHKKDGLRLHRRAELLYEYFGADRPMYTLTSMQMAEYQEHIVNELGLTNATVNRRISPMSVMWKVAATQDRVRMSDMPTVLARTEPEGRLRWLFPDEEQQLGEFFDQAGKRELTDWLKFSIDTGLRTSEVEQVRPVHISRDYELTISATYDEDGKLDWFTKNAKSRTLPLTSRAREIVDRRSTKLRLFDDVTYSNLTYWFRKANRILFDGDTSVTPYVTRHTCASRLVQGGMDLAKIKKWMGHSSIKVTERYAKMSSKDILHGVDVLEGFVADSKSSVIPLSGGVN